MLARGVNSPLSSGAGRLFDAVGFLVTGRAQVSFEAQAAIELEGLAARCRRAAEPCEFGVRENAGGGAPLALDPDPAVRRIVADAARGRPPEELAAAFHAGLARATAELAGRLAERAGVRDVLLSGGCFQNRLLLAGLAEELVRRGLAWHANREVPANDAGVALGQALAAVRMKGD
jgi:hydrogenase maturation protein HypF